MPNYTPNLALVKPTENEYYDVNVVNANMDKLDALTHIVASGTVTSTRSQVNYWNTNGGSITWHYKKYDDGTFEAHTRFSVNDVRCDANDGEDGTWRSGYVQVNYPNIGQTEIWHRAVAVCSGSGLGIYNWAVDTSNNGDDTGAMAFTLISLARETRQQEKVMFVSIKGSWA